MASIFEDFEGPGPTCSSRGGSCSRATSRACSPCSPTSIPAGATPRPASPSSTTDRSRSTGRSPTAPVSTGGATNAQIEYGIPGHYIVNVRRGTRAGTIRCLAIQQHGRESRRFRGTCPGPRMTATRWWGRAALRPLEPSPEPRTSLVRDGGCVPAHLAGAGASGGTAVSSTSRPSGVADARVDPIGDMLIEDGAPDVVQIRLGVYGPLRRRAATTQRTRPRLRSSTTSRSSSTGSPGRRSRRRSATWRNDGFPRVPVFDVSTQAARDQQDIAFDMAATTQFGPGVRAFVPGDSVALRGRPGHSRARRSMTSGWSGPCRRTRSSRTTSAPARPVRRTRTSSAGAQVWTGEVVAGQMLARRSAPGIADRWDAELPDVDFMYPGDVLHYYFQATDNHGRVTTTAHEHERIPGLQRVQPVRPRVHRARPALGRDVAGRSAGNARDLRRRARA